MIKFEQIGVELQNDAVNKYDARKKFEHSCNVCCTRGIRLDCDRCAIAATHKATVAAFESYKGR